MERRDDRALVRGARAGDREAAAELFRRHWPAAWRVAYSVTRRRALADDVAADAFERVFATLARFDDGRPFRPWLHRIVVNRALDLLRTERRLVGGSPPVESADPHPAEGDGVRELLEAIAGLPLPQRVVVILRYGVGMRPSEIAATLELPVGTVNSRLARALEQLRDDFEVRGVQGR